MNVTGRYIRLYQEQLAGSELNDDEVLVDVVLYKNQSEQGGQGRISQKITVWEGEEQIDFGFTPQPTDDLNKFLKFRLKKDKTYRFEFADTNGEQKSQEINTGSAGCDVIKLSLI